MYSGVETKFLQLLRHGGKSCLDCGEFELGGFGRREGTRELGEASRLHRVVQVAEPCGRQQSILPRVHLR